MTEVWIRWKIVSGDTEMDRGFGPMLEELVEAIRIYRVDLRQSEKAQLQFTLYELAEIDSFVLNGLPKGDKE